MPINSEMVEAFLKCETKSYLYFIKADGHSEFTNWRQHFTKEFKRKCRGLLRCDVSAAEWYEGTPPLLSLKTQRYKVIADYKVDTGMIRSNIDALVPVPFALEEVALLLEANNMRPKHAKRGTYKKTA